MRPINFETLSNSAGLNYTRFRRSLRPKYYLVGVHLTLIYIALTANTFTLILMARNDMHSLSFWLSAFFGASIYGFLFAALSNFLHEAIHYNLAPTRQWNERLAALLISPILGLNLNSARYSHFAHHQYLGTENDGEITYRAPLNFRTVAEAILVIKIFYFFLKKLEKTNAPLLLKKTFVYTSFCLHAAVLLAGVYFGLWNLILAWFAGLVSFMPLIAGIRQTLEHKPETHDTNQVVGRLFGQGILASTLGCAGFNRHLLHHWEPQLSYTCLKDLENYLWDTQLATTLRASKTTYVSVFFKLFKF